MNFLRVFLVAILFLFIYTCCDLQKEHFGNTFILTGYAITSLKWIEDQIYEYADIYKNEHTFVVRLKLILLYSINTTVNIVGIIFVLICETFIGSPLRVLGCITLTLFNFNPVGFAFLEEIEPKSDGSFGLGPLGVPGCPIGPLGVPGVDGIP